MIADDLFAGAGGWDLAAEALGIHARGIENMPAARATRDAAGLTTIHDDVWTFAPDGQASGLIASPPCQTFSAAGKGTGRKALDDVLKLIPAVPYLTLKQVRAEAENLGDEERTALVLTPLWFAFHHPYTWVAWEQVPQVLPVWQACAEVLRNWGWSVWTGLLHSETFGVPQTRKRAFLLASRPGIVTPPVATHSRYHNRTPERLDEGVLPWVSMAEALGWGLARRPSPTITGGGTETGGAEPIAKLSRYTSRPDWTRMAAAGTTSVPGRPRSLAHPGATITGKGTAYWMNERERLRLSPAECGVLQSFPGDFPWQGTKGKQYLQAGNAVPPLMAMHALAAATGLAVPTAETAEENVA